MSIHLNSESNLPPTGVLNSDPGKDKESSIFRKIGACIPIIGLIIANKQIASLQEVYKGISSDIDKLKISNDKSKKDS